LSLSPLSSLSLSLSEYRCLCIAFPLSPSFTVLMLWAYFIWLHSLGGGGGVTEPDILQMQRRHKYSMALAADEELPVAIAFSDMQGPSDEILHEYIFAGDLYWGTIFKVLRPPCIFMTVRQATIHYDITNMRLLDENLAAVLPGFPVVVVDIIGRFSLGNYPWVRGTVWGPSLSLSLCLSHSLCLSLFLSRFHCACLCACVRRCVVLSLSLSLCIPLSPFSFLCLSLCLSLFSMPLFSGAYLWPDYFSLSVSLSLSLCLSVSLSLPLSLSFSLCLCLSRCRQKTKKESLFFGDFSNEHGGRLPFSYHCWHESVRGYGLQPRNT
jgi:hypothetical protein